MTAPAPLGQSPLRVLFLCTGNSARSQLAEAALNRKGAGRFVAESAGSRPVARINPYTVLTLRDHGYDWLGHAPRGIDDIIDQRWDFVITVCDRAKESCPVLPGQPVLAHWGVPDPADVEGTEEDKRRAFDDAFRTLNIRIDLLLSLPIEKLERLALESHLRSIGQVPGERPLPAT